MLVMVSKVCPVGFASSMWSIFFSLNDIAGTISGTLVCLDFMFVFAFEIVLPVLFYI